MGSLYLVPYRHLLYEGAWIDFYVLFLPKRRTMSRGLDYLVVGLNAFFIFSCVAVERVYCLSPVNPLAEPVSSAFMMAETADFAKACNPLFLARPAWLRFATCISAFCFAPCYLAFMVAFSMGNRALHAIRTPALCFLAVKVYALVSYHGLVFFGGEAVPPTGAAMAQYWSAEAPYLLGLSLALRRFLALGACEGSESKTKTR